MEELPLLVPKIRVQIQARTDMLSNSNWFYSLHINASLYQHRPCYVAINSKFHNNLKLMLLRYFRTSRVGCPVRCWTDLRLLPATRQQCTNLLDERWCCSKATLLETVNPLYKCVGRVLLYHGRAEIECGLNQNMNNAKIHPKGKLLDFYQYIVDPDLGGIRFWIEKCRICRNIFLLSCV